MKGGGAKAEMVRSDLVRAAKGKEKGKVLKEKHLDKSITPLFIPMGLVGVKAIVIRTRPEIKPVKISVHGLIGPIIYKPVVQFGSYRH